MMQYMRRIEESEIRPGDLISWDSSSDDLRLVISMNNETREVVMLEPAGSIHILCWLTNATVHLVARNS